VLVAEDSAAMRALLVELVRSLHHEPVPARTGGEVLELALRDVPALVVLDLHLPGRSGYDLARAFRGEPVLESVALLAISGSSDEEERDRAEAAGFAGYLSKPFTPERFCDEVTRLLPGA
jgi:CheY-like chemotaxis protein